jgi:glyoxylase-like metal-dependent hydrolase (beta-lactamase superfamily II)
MYLIESRNNVSTDAEFIAAKRPNTVSASPDPEESVMSMLAAVTRLLAPSVIGLAALAGPVAAQTAAPLSLQTYQAGEGSFHVSATLISGETDAVLIDTGFTRADALRIAAMVLDSGKTLRTIYISQADPDFYFGIEVLKQYFPAAQVVATQATRDKIEASLQTKLQVWGPRLGANAPQRVPLPEALSDTELLLEGQALEIRGLEGAAPHRSYLWIPSLRAIVGGVNVFAGLHAWTADTQSIEARAAWIQTLDAMTALDPQIVVPGHARLGAAQDASQIAYTRAYLTRFESELATAADSAGLINAMQQAYPNAGLGIALEIGAKVNTGEMDW